MKRPLSRRLLDAAGKPNKRVVYGDSAMRNLLVVIEKSGRVYWRWQGRVDGKITQVRLGQYPVMDVGEARRAAARLTEARDLAKMYGERLEVPRDPVHIESWQGSLSSRLPAAATRSGVWVN